MNINDALSNLESFVKDQTSIKLGLAKAAAELLKLELKHKNELTDDEFLSIVTFVNDHKDNLNVPFINDLNDIIENDPFIDIRYRRLTKRDE